MDKTVFPSRLGGTLAVMPSKSASHRAVMMAALAGGKTAISPLQLSRDVEATLECAKALGLAASAEVSSIDGMPGFVRARIGGSRANGSFHPTGAVFDPEGSLRGDTSDGNASDRRSASSPIRTLDCGESGSTLRFFIPLALDGRGPVCFVGHGRLMQRPLSVYEQLFIPRGISWRQDGDRLTVDGKLSPGTYALPGDVSSQFITGLLLALPQLDGDSAIRLTTPLESRAYVELTRRVQATFGVISHWEDNGQTLVVPGRQKPASPGDAHVEGDWSHAAFYLVAGALGDKPVSLTGLDIDSAQGDRSIVPILRAMGADIREQGGTLVSHPAKLRARDIDASQIPDLVPILAVAMAAAEGESRITGAARLRIKESDRLAAMRAALCATGADVTELPDGLVIRGGRPLHAAAIDGCNDHRVVMAMAVASALADGPFTISDAQAVAKSAPAFWEEFTALGGKIR